MKHTCLSEWDIAEHRADSERVDARLSGLKVSLYVSFSFLLVLELYELPFMSALLDVPGPGA